MNLQLVCILYIAICTNVAVGILLFYAKKTMSFEEGFRMTDMQKLRKSGIDPKKVAAAQCTLFAELMMVHGFVHADPHPGNVLVRPRANSSGEFDVVLLDHGMYRRLDEQFRSSYCQLWAGLVTGNDSQAMKGVRGLGLPDSYLDLMGLMLTYRIPSGLNVSTVAGKDFVLFEVQAARLTIMHLH